MKRVKSNNILISSFTNKKFPLLNSVNLAKNKINKKIKVFLGNTIFLPYNLFASKQFILMPLCIDKNKYKILSILKKFKIKLVVPTSDTELLFWSKNKEIFKMNQINILIPDYQPVKICNDKLAFHDFCINNNIPDIKILKKKEYSKPNIRLVVKERYSYDKNKIIINQKYNYIKKYLHEYKNPIFQKYIPGKEISIDAYLNENKKVVGIFLRTRDHINDGESQVTTIFKNNYLEKKFIKFFESLNLSGAVMLQAIIIKNKIFVIECNPRVGGATTLSIQCGLDIFFWTLKTIENENYSIQFKRNNKNKLFRFPVDFYFTHKIKKTKKIKFKIVTNLSHAKIIYEINNDPMSRRFSVKVKKINYKNHLIWLNKNIKDQNKKIYLTVINNKIVGMIRTEKDKNNISKISWAVSKTKEEKNMEKKCLKVLLVSIQKII